MKNMYEKYSEILLQSARDVNDQADEKELRDNMMCYGEVTIAAKVLRDFGHRVKILFDLDNEFFRIKELKIDYTVINLDVKKQYLTYQERAFCEVTKHGYIARDQNGILNWHESQPIKFEKEWIKGMDTCRLCGDIFNFIKWEDAEPWNVEKLLAE